MRSKAITIIVAAFVAAGAARFGWAMGTPPFDAVLRSFLGDQTRTAIRNAGCLARTDTITVSSTYRRNRSRRAIEGADITTTFSFQGRNRKGESRLITVSLAQATDANGTVTSSRTLTELLAEVNAELASRRFYRGVERVRGPVQISFSPADLFERSVRLAPTEGFFFEICDQQ